MTFLVLTMHMSVYAYINAVTELRFFSYALFFFLINNIIIAHAIQHFFFSYLDYILFAHSSSDSLKGIDYIFQKFQLSLPLRFLLVFFNMT